MADDCGSIDNTPLGFSYSMSKREVVPYRATPLVLYVDGEGGVSNTGSRVIGPLRLHFTVCSHKSRPPYSHTSFSVVFETSDYLDLN